MSFTSSNVVNTTVNDLKREFYFTFENERISGKPLINGIEFQGIAKTIYLRLFKLFFRIIFHRPCLPAGRRAQKTHGIRYQFEEIRVIRVQINSLKKGK